MFFSELHATSQHLALNPRTLASVAVFGPKTPAKICSRVSASATLSLSLYTMLLICNSSQLLYCLLLLSAQG